MPVVRQQRKKPDPVDRLKMATLLTEVRRRGLEEKVRELGIVEDVSESFHVDENGYFIRQDNRKFNPSESQKQFIESNAAFCAFIGGRGSGKTAAGTQKALRKIAQGQNGAILNPDFENFKISTWFEFRQWVPWEAVVPAHRYRSDPSWQPTQPFVLTFMNGANVICKGLKDPESARGPNINWLWYDEASRDRDGLAWTIAIASVRVGKNPQRFVTTTPKGLNWVYNLFIEQKVDPKVIEEFSKISDRKLIEIFRGTIDDNRNNLDPEFIMSMKTAYPSGYLYSQEILGEFVEEGGSLGDRHWFDGKIVDKPMEGAKRRIRYWDLAASERKITRKRDPDETVGTLLSWDGDKTFYIEDQISGRWEWKSIKEVILQTAVKDGVYVEVFVEQEPGSGGINQVAELRSYLEENLGKSFPQLKGHPPSGDKIVRANTWFAEAAEGNFYLVAGNWINDFLTQLDNFPAVEHDDKIDSVSGARQVIAPYQTYKRIEFLHL